MCDNFYQQLNRNNNCNLSSSIRLSFFTFAFIASHSADKSLINIIALENCYHFCLFVEPFCAVNAIYIMAFYVWRNWSSIFWMALQWLWAWLLALVAPSMRAACEVKVHANQIITFTLAITSNVLEIGCLSSREMWTPWNAIRALSFVEWTFRKTINLHLHLEHKTVASLTIGKMNSIWTGRRLRSRWSRFHFRASDSWRHFFSELHRQNICWTCRLRMTSTLNFSHRW